METISEIIRKSLEGKIKTEENFNPSHLAAAIMAWIQFTKPMEKGEKGLFEAREEILKMRKEMEAEIPENPEEKDRLFVNFLRGKITSYDEILHLIQEGQNF